MAVEAQRAERGQSHMMWSAFLVSISKSWDIVKSVITIFKGGGAAGLFVDVVLFPLDTLKTRLQAEQGFKNAGGFRGIYKGLGPQIVGSAPQGKCIKKQNLS